MHIINTIKIYISAKNGKNKMKSANQKRGKKNK